jgi:hydrogenase nickel incorporation protein HypA/HybF
VHEMGITQEVLRAVTDASAAAGAVRITHVTLTVGALTDLVPDSLHFAWDALTPGTVAEGAELEIRETPGRSQCLQCEAEFDHGKFDRRCTECGSFMTSVILGDELMVDHIEVDLPGDDVAIKE